jgi:arylsulfatase A-like enzyme
MDYLPPPYSTMFTSPPAPYFMQREEETGIPITERENSERFHSWYDNELASLDFHIGTLFAKLKNMGIYDKSLVVVTSDHGELLGEHDDFGHEFWLYQELLHVPLLVKFPFQKNGGTIRDDVVQIIDVFAELLTQSGFELPPFTQGQPLDRVSHPIIAEVKRNPAYTRSWPKTYDKDLTTLFAKPFPGLKYIRSTDGRDELYDLGRDPSEEKNLYSSLEIGTLEKELEKYLDYLDQLEIKKLRKTVKRKMDKATLKRLHDLGYIK